MASPTVKIRVPDHLEYEKVFIDDVNSSFLQSLFELDFEPMYLRSDDKSKELMPISEINRLRKNEHYVIELNSFKDKKDEIRSAVSLTYAVDFIGHEAKECTSFWKNIGMKFIENGTTKDGDVKFLIAKYKASEVFIALKKESLEVKDPEAVGMTIENQCSELFELFQQKG